MEGAPASNAYGLPTAVGFKGHAINKQRLPATTFGRKSKCFLDRRRGDCGVVLDLRDKTRYGKSHQTKYHFSERPDQIYEGNPAPNHYYPKMDPVLKKAPQPSFKRRTHFGRPDNVTPSPNKYTLQTGYPKPCKKSPCGSIKPRFQQKSEGNPAPNIYHVPSTAKYKYGKTAAITMTPIREPVIKADSVPPPNLYSSQTGVQCSIKSPLFGQKSSYKRAVYMTVEDFI